MTAQRRRQRNSAPNRLYPSCRWQRALRNPHQTHCHYRRDSGQRTLFRPCAGFPGEYQIDFQVPPGVASGDDVPVVITLGYRE